MNHDPLHHLRFGSQITRASQNSQTDLRMHDCKWGHGPYLGWQVTSGVDHPKVLKPGMPKPEVIDLAKFQQQPTF